MTRGRGPGQGHFRGSGQGRAGSPSPRHRRMPDTEAMADDEYPRSTAGAIGPRELVLLLGNWSSGVGSIHANLASAVRGAVRDGAIADGATLPSERALAKVLGVSRTTVSHAFDELRGEGVIVSRQGSGTRISRAGATLTSRRVNRLTGFGVDGESSPRVIDLRSAALKGLPMVAEELGALATSSTHGVSLDDVLAQPGYFPAGWPPLRDAVAAYYRDMGLPTTPDQILVTSGSQQAIAMTVQVVTEPGDLVVLEEPTFRSAIDVVRAAGARVRSVPSGPGGVDLAALERLAASGPRISLVVVQSGPHNPTGAVLSERDRARLADFARRSGIALLDHAPAIDALAMEDDASGPPRPVASWHDDVLMTGSVSKSFWGGIRVGWLRAPAEFVSSAVTVKSPEDLGTSTISQMVATRLLGRIDEARAQRSSELLSARGDAIAAVRRCLPEWGLNEPSGGASLWLTLPDSMPDDADAFTQRAARAGVLLLPGSTFSPRGGLARQLRVSFAGRPEDIVEAIERLSSL